MRRFLAAVLSSSLPLLVVLPADAVGGRTLQYSVVATSGGIARRATVTIDFIGGSAERMMNVNVDEVPDAGPPLDATIGIEPTGALRAESPSGLTNEEEALCSLMALDLVRDDGSEARWSGTMLYDADSSVPSTITLSGNVSESHDPADSGNVAMQIHLIHDTFKHY